MRVLPVDLGTTGTAMVTWRIKPQSGWEFVCFTPTPVTSAGSEKNSMSFQGTGRLPWQWSNGDEQRMQQDGVLEGHASANNGGGQLHLAANLLPLRI